MLPDNFTLRNVIDHASAKRDRLLFRELPLATALSATVSIVTAVTSPQFQEAAAEVAAQGGGLDGFQIVAIPVAIVTALGGGMTFFVRALMIDYEESRLTKRALKHEHDNSHREIKRGNDLTLG